MKAADMHCDTIYELYEDHKNGGNASIRSNSLHLDLEKMAKGGYCLQNFAIFVHLEKQEKPFECAMEMIDTFYQEMEANKDLIGVVKNCREMEENQAKGRLSAMLTLEEGGACQGKLSYLRDFYRLGVRMMTLTWNFPNQLGHPNRIIMEGPKKGCYPDTEHGLTETGLEFLEEMERLGMIIDVSHLGDQGIWDVFSHTTKPFVASHSNARALASHPRNLTDEMIRSLGQRGGVAGINYCPAFLRDWSGEEKPKSLVEDMVRHMRYMADLGGIGCVGLGSDFDGITGDLEMGDAGMLPLLEAEMRRQGFAASEIEAVFYKNVFRVYKDILG
ncbi:MAG: membrane dipeptidase [Hungatella sp.]|jgi:membrane dipeptidase|nr:membrane dipeptidase [Hungatella sp.]